MNDYYTKVEKQLQREDLPLGKDKYIAVCGRI